ncbi:hypothetical protein [uncultured Pseudodesulfovibrio sp.]|uniref:hypothetical protein n=1 Tax=uncultured Pseudodesulfovibrio sp. TaxID=2035858 RepID=UPI0029C74CED|nr:hypothetical protein [uncultured Pseudodesulfovibrio sp.]
MNDKDTQIISVRGMDTAVWRAFQAYIAMTDQKTPDAIKKAIESFMREEGYGQLLNFRPETVE